MIYVTGITGNSGSWFLERLVKENYKGRIKCLVRENSNTEILDSSVLNIEKVYGSLEDKEVLESSMAGVKTVMHISSILYSNNVIDAAIKNNVEWAVLVHTTGRYSKHKSASAEYIEIEEEILKKRNRIGITVLRPTMIYGSSRDRNMYKLVDYLYRHKFFPIFGSGKNLMQPVHAKDLGYAYYDVISNRSKTFNKEYNLPGQYPIDYISLVNSVSKKLGRKNTIVNLPLWLSIFAARIYNVINKNAIISVEQVLRMQEDKAFNYVAATQDFCYSPIAFEEGIHGEINEYISTCKRGN